MNQKFSSNINYINLMYLFQKMINNVKILEIIFARHNYYKTHEKNSNLFHNNSSRDQLF